MEITDSRILRALSGQSRRYSAMLNFLCYDCHFTRFAVLLILALMVGSSNGHVSLTFPPARYPSSDFLDNVRTKGPCGVPKPAPGKGNPTTLRSGSTFNVTWTLTYPHQGGFRIELLDDKDQPRYALTPENVQFVGQEDQTAQTYQVTLPSDFECQNCGIRLLRQAGEWGDYQFWSCADVNILREPKDSCQGHGELKDGQCRCDRLYSGESCQTKDECWVDQDCGINGKCEELRTFSFPRRVCYCKQGWYGQNCNSPSPLQKSSLDTSQYQSYEFGADKNKMFWRILKDQNELEVILQYPSKSWIAIGWRPETIPASCGNLERLFGKGLSSGSNASVPNPLAEPAPAVSEGLPTLPNLPPYTTNETLPPAPVFPQFNGTAQNGNSSNADVPVQPSIVARITGGTTVVPSPPLTNQTVSSPQTTISANGKSAESPAEGPLVTGFPRSGTGTEFTGSPVPFPPPYASGNGTKVGQSPNGGSDVVGELCYGDWRFPPDCNENCDMRTSWTYIEESDEVEFSIEAKTPPNTWTALGFSATGSMADADMIVVKSLQNKITVTDMFTNGYAPPARDPQQNVSAGPVPGTRTNGVLRTSFRRPRRSSDTHDVSFTETDCYFFLLATGTLNADGSMNKHTTKPRVSKRKVCIGSCNPSPLGGGSGEKYVTCDREFKFPPGCKPPACDYMANWTYVAQTQEVIFQISAKEIGRWTGIGFSREGNMTNSDMVMGWVYENGTFVTDRFAYGRHQPAIDKQQDLRDVHGIIEDDIQTITFTRKMITNDPEDISLKECLYYLFPVGGGRVLARTSKDFQDKTTPLGFHDQTLPKISRDLICICNDEGIPVNITSARLRRQAQSEDDEDSEDATTNPTSRRPPSLPQGQSAINITLGARPIPVFDPQTLEETLRTATPAATTAVQTTVRATEVAPTFPTTTAATAPPTAPPTTDAPQASTSVITPSRHTTSAPETEITTGLESLLRLQSAIVSVNTSQTVPTLTDSSGQAQPSNPVSATAPTRTPPALPATSVPPAISSPLPEPAPAINGTASTVPASSVAPPQAEPSPTPSVAPPRAELSPKGHPAPEPEPKPEGRPSQGSADLHPMDCVDMVIGSAVGSYSRIGDYYSVSRATPKPDDYFGGVQSLTAATGFEENGVTTVAFRRRLTSSDPFDHNITVDNSMFFIWAKGQEAGNYSHNGPSGLDQGSASIKDFYTPDVLAYHGNKNRGSFTLNLSGTKQSSTTSPNATGGKTIPGCRQDFLYPAGCKGQSCHYNVTWLKFGNDIEFSIEADIANNHWTGIAFSKDGLMAKSDAIIIMAESVGAPEVTDRYMSGYDAPIEDKKQDIFNIEASYINGRVKARFTRPLQTGDTEEDLDLNDCVYFLYPYNGGPIADNRVQKHSATPLRSTEKICLNKCQINAVVSLAGAGGNNNAETAKTPAIAKKPADFVTPAPVVDHGRKFSAIVRILNEPWSDALAIAGSPEYEALSAKIIKVMDTLLRSRFAGFDKARIVKFTQGSVIAELEVLASGVNSVQLQEAIIPQASAGPIDGLQFDPEYVRVKEIQVGLTPEEIRNYAIIAVACFLVMVATAFAVCMIMRTRRRRSKEIKSNWNLVPFTPYAYLMPPSGAYPVAYQYPALAPMGAIDPKKAPMYHESHYSTDYSATGNRQLGTHHRQYSNATTATPVNGKTPSPTNDKHVPSAGAASSHKNGNGETSYAEWFHRINNGQGQPQPQPQSQAARGQQQGSGPSPYVQYPNDPYSFYTMGGSQRAAPFLQTMAPRPAPPPGYYRPY